MSPYPKALRAGMPWPVNDHAEPETDKDLAPRTKVAFACVRQHEFSVPFAADVTPPDDWQCRCGQPARRGGAPRKAPARPVTPGYTTPGERHRPPAIDVSPMAQLRKRRSKKEGAALLAERLAEVRESGVAR